MSISPPLPLPRGPISGSLLEYLAGARRTLPAQLPGVADPIRDDDLQLALYCCYELHYRGFDIERDLEWDPDVIGFRRRLEQQFRRSLRARTPVPESVGAADVPARLRRLIADFDGPSLSRFMVERGTPGQFREFAIHRSIYQLKEADPHTFAIRRTRPSGSR